MDIRSGYDGALEAVTDEAEGADIIMVKPATTYLDVARQVSDSVTRPVAVYNVSGEYSMVMSSTLTTIHEQIWFVKYSIPSKGPAPT